jgi:hypothetical protein
MRFLAAIRAYKIASSAPTSEIGGSPFARSKGSFAIAIASKIH